MDGLIHLYLGDGKGKTTAAVGLCVRAAGRGLRVVFAQFLKSGVTGELDPLERLGVQVIRSTVPMKFTFQMNDAEKQQCREEQRRVFDRTRQALADGAELIVLDEVLDALGTGMLDDAALQAFLAHRETGRAPATRAPDGRAEVVLTGRNPPAWLLAAADYVTEMRKVKHPYDQGVAARTGIER